jgi:molecular chaperone GrpE
MSKKSNLKFDESQAKSIVKQTSDDNVTDELAKKNQEYLAGWQRAKADYLNLKKETDEIIGKLRQVTRAEFFVEFLPYWQNLTTAIAHIPADLQTTDWAQGFKHSQRQIEDWLKDSKIKKIETVGEKFDYSKHEAVETVWDEKKSNGEIIEEKLAGYEYDGQVIIHPKVVVNIPLKDKKIF